MSTNYINSIRRKAISVNIAQVGRNIVKQRWGYFFIIPAMLFFLLFVFYPFISAIRMSFYDVSTVGEKFIGFENYRTLFADKMFYKSLANTLKIVLFAVPIDMVLSIVIAYIIFDKKPWLVSFVRGAFYIPTIVPGVCTALIWRWLYNPQHGIFNSILGLLNLPRVDFIGNADTAIYAVIVVLVTWTIGQPIILNIASLSSIPIELFEAAHVDGASGFSKLWYITLPLLRPTTLYNLVVLTIGCMQIVEIILLITNGGPYGSTSTLLFMIYENAFKHHKYGYAATLGNIVFVIIFILSILQFKYFSLRENS